MFRQQRSFRPLILLQKQPMSKTAHVRTDDEDAEFRVSNRNFIAAVLRGR